jgi:hypothetical protein
MRLITLLVIVVGIVVVWCYLLAEALKQPERTRGIAVAIIVATLPGVVGGGLIAAYIAKMFDLGLWFPVVVGPFFGMAVFVIVLSGMALLRLLGSWLLGSEGTEGEH